MDIQIHRYGKALFELDTLDLKSGLTAIQDQFIYFLDVDLNQDHHIQQIHDFVTDTQLIHIYQKSMEVYPDMHNLENEIEAGFSYFSYHFPSWESPEVYTYISGMFYENPVILSDSVMIIAVDVYLGKNFPPYRSLGLPNYKLRTMEAGYISIDVMEALYYQQVYQPRRTLTLLEKMVEEGKRLYYLDAVLPEHADSLKIAYTQSQMDWVQHHKKEIWAFLIKEKLLYSTDSKFHRKLMEDGPFTTAFSTDSPARIGHWVGWEIVRSYMQQYPDTQLKELMRMSDAQELLRLSEYKP